MTSLLLVGCGEGSLDPNANLDELYGQDEESDDDAADDEEPDDDDGQGREFSPSAGHQGSSVSRGEPDPEDVPPGDAERPSYVDSSGFFVLDGRLYDKYGNDFVMRGVNNAHAWYDTGGRNLAIGALDDIADYGFNTVRIVWQTEEVGSGTSVFLLHQIIDCIVELGMVPMLELHDVTGVPQGLLKHVATGELVTWQELEEQNLDRMDYGPLPDDEANDFANERLLDMAEYFTRDDVKEVLLQYEDYLLLNIANEWSGQDYFGGYSAAIEHMRDNGLDHTLVLDANGWGQNAAVILQEGQALLDADPQHNLLFSTHMYESYSNSARITEVLEAAVELRLPFIVGEFGPEHAGQTIDVEFIFAETTRLGIGYIAWSWKGNSEGLEHLDMSLDWEGVTLSPWGQRVVMAEGGVADTSKPATMFTF